MAARIGQDGIPEFIIAPDAIVDYGIDWGIEITPETVITSNWEISPTLTLTNPSIVGNVTSVFVNLPVNGKVYLLTNKITTATKTDSRSIRLACQPKGAC